MTLANLTRHENQFQRLSMSPANLTRRENLELRGVVVSLLHNFIQQSLNSGSPQVQILHAMCRRFEMVRIFDNGPGWK